MTEQCSFLKSDLLLILESLKLHRNGSFTSAALRRSFSVSGDSLERQLHASAEGEMMIAGLSRWLFQKLQSCDELHFSDTEALFFLTSQPKIATGYISVCCPLFLEVLT